MAEVVDQLFDKISSLLNEAESKEISNAEELEQFRIEYLGSKGKLKDLFSNMKDVPGERKREFGQACNQLKQSIEAKFESLQNEFKKGSSSDSDIDLTLPGYPLDFGSLHPVTLVKNQIVDIFEKIGFTISEGPEIEDDFHNFTALNFPADHPARDMQDTYFINNDPDIVLRTHTSSVQVRVMENSEPPIRTISPGRVYRNETISARSHCFFHQVEGLYIDENVSLADLKQTLLYFAREFFGADTKIRLRPSYFPFTEPSAEMDVSCFICGGDGCSVCKHTGWVEILGCGMVDPNVLENCGIDSKKYTGYAFGMGVERITMLKYQIKDIRLLSENDQRFLEQFKHAF